MAVESIGGWVPAVGLAAGSAFGGNLFAKGRQDRAYHHSKKLMKQQKLNQMELNTHGHELNMKAWRETNYPAQVKQLIEAGLNPALLYGKGGAGGTTGNQSGGSASGGQGQIATPMEIGLLMQAMKLKAEIDLAKSTARKSNAEARDQELDNETKAMFGQQADKAEAQNRYSHAVQKGTFLYDQFKDNKTVHSNFTKDLENDLVIKEVERNIAQETEHNVKMRVAYETASSALDAKLKAANIELTKEQARKVWHDIWVAWTNAGLRGLDTIIKGRLGDIGKKMQGANNKGFKDGVEFMKKQ